MSGHRVAVLGFGRWGRNHARNFHALGALAAIVETDPEARELAACAYPELPVFADPEAVLADATIAGLVVATPAVSHAEIARRGLAAGKDLFVEKPMALTVPEAERLVAQAHAAGRILMVGHLLEYHPGLREVARLVAEGAVGRLRFLSSRRLSLGTVRDEENVLWSFAPHDVALLTRLAGGSPQSVTTTGGAWVHPDRADATWSLLRFADGVLGQIETSWLHPFKEHRLVVVGEEGTLCFEDRPEGPQLRRWAHRVAQEGGRAVVRKAEAELLPLPSGEPLRAECAAFLAAIASRQPPRTDGESGLAVLRVLAACQRSLDSGGGPVAVREEASAAGGVGFFVHPSAIVDEGARLGEGARIWHFSHVMGSAEIGPRANLGQNVFVGPRVKIGAGCKLQNNVSVYEGVELEEEVFCGPSMVFTNVRTPRAHVERKDEFAVTRVGRRATLGANSTIVCGTRLGAYCLVGAGAVVTRDVPAHALVVGGPARVMGWVCACGERLDLPASPPEGATARCERCGDEYVFGGRGLEAR